MMIIESHEFLDTPNTAATTEPLLHTTHSKKFTGTSDQKFFQYGRWKAFATIAAREKDLATKRSYYSFLHLMLRPPRHV